MENQPTEVSTVENHNQAPLAGVQAARAPWHIQIVVGLLWFMAIINIFYGIPLLLVFGLGFLYILQGALIIIFAQSIHRLERNGYVGGMVLMGVLLFFIFLNLKNMEQREGLDSIRVVVGAVIYMGCMAILYKHRRQFVGKRVTVIKN